MAVSTLTKQKASFHFRYIFLLTRRVAAERFEIYCRKGWQINSRWKLKHFQTMHRSDWCRQGYGRSLMKPLRLHIFVTEPSR